MKIRTVNILGFAVDIYSFDGKQYYYPQFNGDAEFLVNKQGYKRLKSYLKNVLWARSVVKRCSEKLFFDEPILTFF